MSEKKTISDDVDSDGDFKAYVEAQENAFAIVPTVIIEENLVVVVETNPNAVTAITAMQEAISATEDELELVTLKLKAMKLKLKQEQKRAISPTTRQTASLNVFVSGKHRQLHNSKEGILFYRTDGNRITPVKKLRGTLSNAVVRASGESIWDGGSISVHLNDPEYATIVANENEIIDA